MKYISYNAVTGEIIWHGTCPADHLQFQAIDGLNAMESDVTGDTHYVLNGVVTPFTDAEIALKKSLRPGCIWKMPERVVVDLRVLDNAKKLKLLEIAAACDRALAPIKSSYPNSEQQTWDKQETEARAVLLNSTAATPLLNALSTARGVPVLDVMENGVVTVKGLATRVIEKADAFATLSGQIIGQRQRYEDQIALATTLAAVDAIVWGS